MTRNFTRLGRAESDIVAWGHGCGSGVESRYQQPRDLPTMIPTKWPEVSGKTRRTADEEIACYQALVGPLGTEADCCGKASGAPGRNPPNTITI
jgi:hypothetical protein